MTDKASPAAVTPHAAQTPQQTEAGLRHLNATLEQRLVEQSKALEHANRELASLSYAISHDLRAPLRTINGFSKIVLAANAGKVDPETAGNLARVAAAGERMGRLIDALLDLSRISRQALHRQAVNLSALAGEVAAKLAAADPQRQVEVLIAPDLLFDADRDLLRIVLENMLSNAWKFSAHTDAAKIEVGQLRQEGETGFFVRDNGAGFDMRYASKLFGAFQRLHTEREFAGIGIGLCIAQRIVIMHGGRIRAEAGPRQGATFLVSLAPGNAAG